MPTEAEIVDQLAEYCALVSSCRDRPEHQEAEPSSPSRPIVNVPHDHAV